MSYIRATFIGKEYSIPQDVLIYIDLLDFTETVKTQLLNAFLRKVKDEIRKENTGLLGDEDLATEIEQQVGRFISKLCDNGIFTRTVSDYLNNNKGYQYFSDVNKAALAKIKSLLMQRLDSLQEGYEDAVQRADSHVTGMGFSIWSSSFVNHAIYAAMEASTINKQQKEASAQYQKEIRELCSGLESNYNREKNQYINNEYIPNMEAALTVLAYELLDRYVADMIAHQKFDAKALDFINIGRSNDLLKNLTLSGNKKAILENAFAACPYNIAVYMQAMKYDLLDYDSFQTAKVFKQDHHVLSFFRESWGEVSFPTKFNINYHCINVWASLTGKTSTDLLRGLTEQYATGIVKAYSRIADMMANKATCRKIIGELREDVILSGGSICIGKAREYVEAIVHAAIWDQLTEKCGHTDLLSRIKKCFPSVEELQSKKDFDSSVTEQLAARFEDTRKELAEQIEARRAEEERQRIERERQVAEQARIQAEKKARRTAAVKKGAKRTLIVVGSIAAACIALVISGIIFLFATDKPIDNDFAERKEYNLHSLTYFAPENWEEDFEYNQSNENTKIHVRYDNWGKFVCMMGVVYHGETQQISIEDVVSDYISEYKDATTKSRQIGEQEFTVISYVRTDDYNGCNVYVTESESSVFEIYFRSVPESTNPVIFDEIVEAIAFDTYVNPKEDAYTEAISLMSDGKYADAYDILKSLGNYKNSNSLIEECLSAVFDENIAQLIAAEKYSEAYGLLISSGNKEQLKHFKAVYTVSSYSDKYYDSNSVYTYDEFGNLLKDVKTYDDGDKKTKEYTYDSYNRLITERITESDSPSDYFETTYEYNAHGQKIKEVTTYDYGNGNAGSYTYEYEYDTNGNMVTSIYSKAGESGEKITKYEYNSNGQITKELYHDGTYYYFEYGSNNELLKKVYVWSDGHESYDSYLYDDNGALVKEMDSYGNSIEYFYDSNYCLIKMVEYDEDHIDSVTEYGEYIVFYLFTD